MIEVRASLIITADTDERIDRLYTAIREFVADENDRNPDWFSQIHVQINETSREAVRT